VRHPHPSLRAAFEAIDTLEYTPSFERCVALACTFLDAL
jgi:hypothetical protein